MYNKCKFKLISCLIAFLLLFNVAGTTSIAYAASAGDLLGALTSSTMPTAAESGGSGGLKIIDMLVDLLFKKLLGPLLNIFKDGNDKTAYNDDKSQKPNVVIKPLPAEPPAPSKKPSKPSTPSEPSLKTNSSDALKGKIIVIDPGHGGSNPGAVANDTRESDNNLSVGLKLRDKLSSAGAQVVMTRNSDRMVDPSSTTLSEELAARVKIADKNNADIFVSIHSNFNSDSSIKGAMTFYHSDRSRMLAQKVQSSLVGATGAADKGISTATFHVLRNTMMPGILVEMGFVSNEYEAKLLTNDSYRNKIATGIYNGIADYFDN